MLRDLVREIGADELVGLLPGSDRATRELARLLPELAGGQTAGDASRRACAARARPGRASSRSSSPCSSGWRRQQPLVLVVEDAHWADRSSRDLIAFLIGYQRALANVLIAVTFRSDELHRTHPLRPLLAELTRIDWVERTELPRLSRGPGGGARGGRPRRLPRPRADRRALRAGRGQPAVHRGAARLPRRLRPDPRLPGRPAAAGGAAAAGGHPGGAPHRQRRQRRHQPPRCSPGSPAGPRTS